MDQSELSFVVATIAPILLGIALLVSQRLISGSRDPFYDDVLNLMLNVAGWALIAVGILGSCASLLGIMSIPWWIAAVVVFIDAVGKYHASQQYALLWLLTVSAERFMPLGPAVEAFARECGGSFGLRAKRLADMLNSGVTLPDALDRCRGLLPRHVAPMVRVGCQSGALAPALRQAATVHHLHDPIWLSLIGKIVYLLWLPAFGLMILTFIMLKIVPSFVKIFADFGSTLPPMTQWLIFLARGGGEFWYLCAPLYLAGLVLILYGIVRYFGWIDWDLPGLARLVRRFDTAAILDALSLVARQQRPLPEGIAALAWSYPKRGVRRRLWRTVADIEVGRDWCESLYRHGLIRRADLAILQAAQRVGNLPWALQEMADSNRRRLAYRIQAAVQVLVPPVVLVFGLVVMFIVVALFLPLIALIQKLA
jgi:type II secretory pathway component PulF